MDESRRQFEEWWDDFTLSRPGRCKSLRSGIGYRNEAANECWKAWQASRQAIEIDLPKACAGDEYFIDCVFQPMRYERDVERALSAAGLKIKGD